MAVKFRNNCDIYRFGKDYHKIRTFLCKYENPNYSYGRWDWMMKHGYLNKEELSKIGLWEEEDEIVAIVLYDTELGSSHFCVNESYNYLKKEMLCYAKDNLNKGEQFEALINDADKQFQQIASQLGFVATWNKECDAYFPIAERSLTYDLPEGFTITCMEDDYDGYKYGQVLWKGFNHEEEEGVYSPTESELKNYDYEFAAPNVNKRLKIAVKTMDGEFASYCGMWYDKNSSYAIVEPVATVPEFRKLGLGKAVVLEGIKRCAELGAKSAFVGSFQQFYYNIGFVPYMNSSYWKLK